MLTIHAIACELSRLETHWKMTLEQQQYQQEDAKDSREAALSFVACSHVHHLKSVIIPSAICCAATTFIQALPCSKTLSLMAFMLLAVTQLMMLLNQSDVLHGTGYTWERIRRLFTVHGGIKSVLLTLFVKWVVFKCITEVYCNAVVCAFRSIWWHSVSQGQRCYWITKNIDAPTMVKRYKKFMGWVDKSDQYELATNAFIFHNEW